MGGLNGMTPSHRGRQISAAEFRRLWCDSTMSTDEIGRHLGITGQAVRTRAKIRALPPRKPGVRSIIGAKAEARIRELWAANVMAIGIAQDLGIARDTANNHIGRLCLPPRPRRGLITLAEFREQEVARRMACAAQAEHQRRRALNAIMSEGVRDK